MDNSDDDGAEDGGDNGIDTRSGGSDCSHGLSNCMCSAQRAQRKTGRAGDRPRGRCATRAREREQELPQLSAVQLGLVLERSLLRATSWLTSVLCWWSRWAADAAAAAVADDACAVPLLDVKKARSLLVASGSCVCGLLAAVCIDMDVMSSEPPTDRRALCLPGVGGPGRWYSVLRRTSEPVLNMLSSGSEMGAWLGIIKGLC